ncbi:MAG: TIGR02206 family membrane protein [Ruminococcaceae bacterium]|nr:TIGR02206 family membrane protein [Oscillospiraceae bacterium]
MKKFCAYFFGKGETEEFTNFTLAHLLPILLMIGIILLIYRYRDFLKTFKHEEKIRYALAFIMIISEMSYYWRLVGIPSLGPTPIDHLPITVCGWGIVFGSYLVIGKSQTLYDICYFWLFAGTIFALLTPTVITYTGPTRFRYYQFWLEHTMGYIGVFYMTFVHKMRPTVKSAIKSYVALAVLAVIAYVANTVIGPGANYLFMAKPESTPSILDILPPNFVLRIIIMATAVTLLYVLSYLPWYFKDRKAKLLGNADTAAKDSDEEKIGATV